MATDREYERSGRDSRQVRISMKTYEMVQMMAQRERRRFIDEIAILVERGIAASDLRAVTADFASHRTERNMGGKRT